MNPREISFRIFLSQTLMAGKQPQTFIVLYFVSVIKLFSMIFPSSLRNHKFRTHPLINLIELHYQSHITNSDPIIQQFHIPSCGTNGIGLF